MPSDDAPHHGGAMQPEDEGWTEEMQQASEPDAMPSCVSCGSPIPKDQGSNTCSMCYGDPDHGKDGYYQEFMDSCERERSVDRNFDLEDEA